MPYYRLYFVDEHNKIKHLLELDCTDDESARTVIEDHRDRHPAAAAIELWQLDRCVGRFPAKRKQE